MVPLPNEQAVILRMKLLRREGLSFTKIARRLNEEQAPARRNGKWRTGPVCIILEREGMHTMRRNRPRIPTRFDPEAATAMARKLREEGLSLNQIGVRLRKEGLTPLRGGKWHPAQVAKLLTDDVRYDRMAVSRRASELRAQGLTLKEVGFRLSVEGFKPKEGGVWYPSRVNGLMQSTEAQESSASAE